MCRTQGSISGLLACEADMLLTKLLRPAKTKKINAETISCTEKKETVSLCVCLSVFQVSYLCKSDSTSILAATAFHPSDNVL